MKLNASKREFLKRAGAIAATGVSTPFAMNLAALAASSAYASDASGYKALVCIFMYGGNDNHNTVVPLDATSHGAYVTARGGTDITGVALKDPLEVLNNSAIVPANPWGTGRQMALHPALEGSGFTQGDSRLKTLFDQGKLSLVMNVGTLLESGTTRTDFDTNSSKLPPKLFSHNDQQSVWQAGAAEGATSGWGGRIGDLFMDANGSSSGFTCISASGNAVYLAGREAVQYQISPDGAIKVNDPIFGSTDLRSAMIDVMGMSSSNLLDIKHASLATTSIAYEQQITAAIGTRRENLCIRTANPLSQQLNIVARLIKANAALGPKRQVFFVSMGGFDTHDTLIDRHQALMVLLGTAMTAFQSTLDALGLSRQVTTFTASDFGRSMSSNGDGSDHGWGSHHLVMGGSLKAKTWVGQLPVFDAIEPGGIQRDQHVGNGRLLPYHSVDEYGATFAKWMGVDPVSEMATVFPNIAAFNTPDLGFLLP